MHGFCRCALPHVCLTLKVSEIRLLIVLQMCLVFQAPLLSHVSSSVYNLLLYFLRLDNCFASFKYYLRHYLLWKLFLCLHKVSQNPNQDTCYTGNRSTQHLLYYIKINCLYDCDVLEGRNIYFLFPVIYIVLDIQQIFSTLICLFVCLFWPKLK